MVSVIALAGRLLVVAVWVVPTPGCSSCAVVGPCAEGSVYDSALPPPLPDSSRLPLVAVLPVFPVLSFHDSSEDRACAGPFPALQRLLCLPTALVSRNTRSSGIHRSCCLCVLRPSVGALLGAETREPRHLHHHLCPALCLVHSSGIRWGRLFPW